MRTIAKRFASFFAKKENDRGQDAVELVILLSVILIVLVAIISFNSSTITGYQAKQEIDESSIVLDSMESIGELVFAQGQGSQSMSIINFPGNLKSISAGNRTINVETATGNVFHRNLEFNVTAENLSSPNGRKALYARAFEGYVVYSFESIPNPLNYTII